MPTVVSNGSHRKQIIEVPVLFAAAVTAPERLIVFRPVIPFVNGKSLQIGNTCRLSVHRTISLALSRLRWIFNDYWSQCVCVSRRLLNHPNINYTPSNPCCLRHFFTACVHDSSKSTDCRCHFTAQPPSKFVHFPLAIFSPRQFLHRQ